MTAARVLYAITTLDRGGAEKALLTLCRARAARSGPQRIGVGYLKGRGELQPEFEALGIEVRDFAVRGLRAARAHRAFHAFVREFAPDVVHSHLFKADLLAASCIGRKRPGRVALVSTKHNEDRYLARIPWRAVGRAAAARADRVVAVSHGVAEFLRRTIGPACGDVALVHCPVEEPARPAVPPPGDGRLLCVARLEPQKDPRTLLDAFRLVLLRRPARLVFLGRGSLESDVRAAVRDFPEGTVELAGFVEDPTPWYDAADVVVLPSLWEGLGLALVEAALRERPAVATAVGGIPEAVADEVTGLLVPPGDARLLAEAILRLLDDPALARQMGRAAAARARERFGVEACLDAHERLYRVVLGERR